MPTAVQRPWTQQLDHPAGAGADVEQPSERPAVERGDHGCLDLALGDMERAEAVPALGVGSKIAGSHRVTLGAHRSKARRIGVAARLPGVERRQHGCRDGCVTQPHENPRALLEAADEADLRQDADVAGYPGLALLENVGKLSDRQFHAANEQQDADPGRISKRAEDVERSGHGRII